MIKNGFFGVVALLLILGVISFSGCLQNGNTPGFSVEKWSTQVEGYATTVLVVEFNESMPSGIVHLFAPSGTLIKSTPWNNSMHNASFVISNSRRIKPFIGNYTVQVKSQDKKTVLNEKIWVKDAHIVVSDCEPLWVYNETMTSFTLTSVNLTIVNSGDVFGYIWEGKVVVDNTSSFAAPDYHWHNLDVWLKPGEEIFLQLPVEVPLLQPGNHFISMLFLEDPSITAAYYESVISTP